MTKTKKFKFKFFAYFLFIFTLYSLLFTSASAHTSGLWTPGDPIVPCGITPPVGFSGPLTSEQQPCTECDILHLLKHLVDFVLVAAAPILATLFFVIAGFYMMLGGANPGMLSRGKSMFKDTFIGLLIVMLTWLITNTLIQSLADPSIFGGGPWYSLSCSNGKLGPGNIQANTYDCNSQNRCVLNPGGSGKYPSPVCNGFCPP
jgi:hypothetical protein